MFSIQSERLQLIPLDHSLLRIWQSSGRETLESQLGLKPNSFQLEEFYRNETETALSNFWIPQTHKYPLDFCWYTNWEIILKPSSCSVGGIGFSGLPDNDGKCEIGYVIDQKFRNKGIAKEAVELLINWANQDPDLKAISAKTFPNNLASQSVLLSTGFKLLEGKPIFLDEETPLLCFERQIKK